MTRLWPDGGAWVLAPTSAAVGWQPPAAVLAAASPERVAVLVLGGTDHPDDDLLRRFATVLTARGGAGEPLSLDEATDIVRTLARTHGLVLITGPGLLVPVDGAQWTVTDLAVALSAPVVVLTDLGGDATNHATLALGALDGRGLSAAVVVVDGGVVDGGTADADSDANGDVLAGLPVSPAGRIPADVVGALRRPDDLPAAARRWLDPILHAGVDRGGPSASPRAASPPAPPPAPRTAVSGTRVVLLLVGAFVAAALVACGLGMCDRGGVAQLSITGGSGSPTPDNGVDFTRWPASVVDLPEGTAR